MEAEFQGSDSVGDEGDMTPRTGIDIGGEQYFPGEPPSTVDAELNEHEVGDGVKNIVQEHQMSDDEEIRDGGYEDGTSEAGGEERTATDGNRDDEPFAQQEDSNVPLPDAAQAKQQEGDEIIGDARSEGSDGTSDVRQEGSKFDQDLEDMARDATSPEEDDQNTHDVHQDSSSAQDVDETVKGLTSSEGRGDDIADDVPEDSELAKGFDEETVSPEKRISEEEEEPRGSDGEEQPPAEAKEGSDRPVSPRRSAEAKRGGRRDSKSGAVAPWRRLLGKQKVIHGVGDLVEAEWQGSGWWFVGYITAVGDGTGTSLHHVMFIDGDEADVQGRFLRQLGPPDHTRGSAGTLARHVAVADLGPGRLHRDLEPQHFPDGDDEEDEYYMDKKGKRRKMKKKHKKNKGSTGKASSPRTGDRPPTLLRERGSVGDIKERRKQGQDALWGKGTPRAAGVHGAHANEVSELSTSAEANAKWWETGTQYAFQPRLTPVLSMTLSKWSLLSDFVVGRGDHSAATKIENDTADRGDSYASFESTPTGHRGREFGGSAAGGGRADTGGFYVVQPAEGHADRGKRVYFAV